jgi:hypothetical protein
MPRKPRDQAEGLRPTEPRPRRRRWLWCPGIALLLAAAAWWLPAILAATGAVQWLVARATADLQGHVALGRVSLGWLRPIVVNEVEVRDAAGQPVAKAPRIESERRLWDLICRPYELGRFRIEQPHLYVVIRDGASNVEQLLAKYLSNKNSPPRAFSLSVEAAAGQVEIVDAAGKRSCQLEQVAVHVSLPASGVGPIEVGGTLRVAGDPSAVLTTQCKLPETATGVWPEVALEAQSVPLETLAPLVERFAPGTRLAGRVTGNLGLSKTGSLLGSLKAEALRASSPLLADALQLRQMKLDCSLAWNNAALTIKQLAAECDLGRLEATGTFSPVDFSADQWRPALAKQVFAANARVDLAALAAQLPRTLRIRAQTQITGGQLELSVSGRPDAQGAAWQGHAQAAAVKALLQGRPVVWQQPIAVHFALRDASDGLHVETLKCQSSFFNLEAQGHAEELVASARFDLGQLSAQLEQFVDLGGVQTAGEGWAYLNWKAPQGKAFTTELEFQARDFRLAVPQLPPWAEPNLVLFLSAAGQMADGVPSRWESVAVSATAATDQWEARLLTPVANWRTATTWPIAARLQGQLEGWPARLRNWIELAPWHPVGRYDLSARLALAPTRISVEQSRLAVNGLNLTVSGRTLVEPNVQVEAAGDWDLTKQVVQLRRLTLGSTALALEGQELVVDLAARDLRVAGAAQYDLERLNDLLRPWVPAGIRFAGQGKQPFWVRGPLTAATAQGEASVAWAAGSVYGFQAGPGQLKAKLAEGAVHCEPITCTLSEGQARFTPRLRLAPLPAEVSCESGMVAEQVRINPTMCQHALSYAAPALAGVATAEGRFSIQLERCRFPLADPATGELAGKLMIHAVEVAPGPLVGQMAAALGYSTPARLSRESSIPFWMQDRRIHHQGMELVFPDVTVRTSGSVGLDRSLTLVASMPVPQKWIGQNVLGTALANQTIELPVSGTLDQPRLDRGRLEQFGRKVIGTAARNLLQDRVQQQLDRLLPARK